VTAARAAPEPDRVPEVASAAGLIALAIGFALLAARKTRAFAAMCAARGVRLRTMVPMPEALRAPAAGAALALGVALQVSGALAAGTASIAAAMLLAALRPPAARHAARGPGRWLVLRPDEAFDGGDVRDAGEGDLGVLDAGTRAGKVTLALVAAGLALVAAAAARFDARAPWMVALDAGALVPLFFTGRACDVAPGVARSAPWLRSVFAQLRAVASLRVAPWARILAGGSTADEVRLLVLPRVAMPGMVGVEVGRAWSTTPVGWASSPEVLVRVLDGSSAAAKLAQVVPDVRSLPGRRPDERVVRLCPRRSTRASTVALTRRLAEALTDRRSAVPAAWAGPSDRRVLRPRAPSPAPASGSSPSMPIAPPASLAPMSPAASATAAMAPAKAC
jgi:hypothetical protein